MTLERALSYRNDDVVFRFSEDHGVPVAEAEEIFTETKRWLWLCAKRTRELEAGRGDSFLVPLFNEANAIDLMWHTFLLFTKDYADFCDGCLGTFIHHAPKRKAERLAWQERIAADPEAAWAERRASLRKVYGYLYDELGAETLKKWCEEFPARFSLRLSPPSTRSSEAPAP